MLLGFDESFGLLALRNIPQYSDELSLLSDFHLAYSEVNRKFGSILSPAFYLASTTNNFRDISLAVGR